jgi:predicted esterase
VGVESKPPMLSGVGEGEWTGTSKPTESISTMVTSAAMLPPLSPVSGRPRILCLHGGGDSAAGLRSQVGMAALQSSMPHFDFIFASAPHSGLWIRDPPGGKALATTDVNWASPSVASLNQIVMSQGPFYGILGYSQGSAMALYYLSQVPPGTFQVAMLFNGYIPSTHLGLVQAIDSQSPFGAIPALVFIGERDNIIVPSMSEALAAKLSNPSIVRSSSAGHHLPFPSDPTFDQVITFLSNPTAPSPVYAPSMTSAPLPPAFAWSAPSLPSYPPQAPLTGQQAHLAPTTTSSQCAKDHSCFDFNYECIGCCSTGLAKNGAPCWDAVYTVSRCCNQGASAAISELIPTPATPVFTPPSLSASTPASASLSIPAEPVYSTAAPPSGETCEKDPTCFDGNYECVGCCSTGQAKNGAPCWDSIYTSSRCCSQGASTMSTAQLNPVSYIAPTPIAAQVWQPTVPALESPATCAKDTTCFDSNYQCQGCCSTGIAKNGAGCWDAVYTVSRCCMSSQSAAVPATQAFTPPSYPSASCTDQLSLCPLMLNECSNTATPWVNSMCCSTCASNRRRSNRPQDTGFNDKVGAGPTAIIAGCVVGGVALLSLVGALLLSVGRYQRRRNEATNDIKQMTESNTPAPASAAAAV